MSYRRVRRARAHPIHVIPDLMELLGATYPATQDTNGYPNAFEAAMESGTPGQRLANTMHTLKVEYTDKNNLIGAAALIVGGLVVKWLGKKTGLDRIGTKKLKVF
jgi:hypothetical protein